MARLCLKWLDCALNGLQWLAMPFGSFETLICMIMVTSITIVGYCGPVQSWFQVIYVRGEEVGHAELAHLGLLLRSAKIFPTSITFTSEPELILRSGKGN